MLGFRLEQERPVEWLRWLAEEPDAYQILLVHAGGLGRAAYRLAKARGRVHGDQGQTVTLRELQAAAVQIARQLGIEDTLPITSLLARDCEEHGLPVIKPNSAPPVRRASAPPLRRAS